MSDRHQRPTRVIALINQKGGVGKTTTTVNLGAAIGQLGRRTLLIDLDPQAHLTLHLGIDPEIDSAIDSKIDSGGAASSTEATATAAASRGEPRPTTGSTTGSTPRPTIYDILIDPSCDPRDALVEARPNLNVIPSTTDLAAAETELAGLPDRNRILARRLAPLVAEHEFVLIDCPPSLGLLTLNALCLAREVFVTMQAHFLALQGVGKLLETVGLVARSVNPSLRVTGVVLCMHEANISHQREVVADLDGFFEAARGGSEPWSGCRVLRPPIRRNIKLAEAPSFGQSILDYAPWCPGAIDYRKLADRVVADWDAMLARKRDSAPTPVAATAATAPPAPIAQVASIAESPTPEASATDRTAEDPASDCGARSASDARA